MTRAAEPAGDPGVAEPRLRSRFYHLKTNIARLLCHPLVGRVIGVLHRDRIPNRGCVIFTDSGRVTPQIKASLYWGIYEAAEVRFVQQYLRPDLDVVELGSSIGVVASHICRHLDASHRLVCVEANPELLDLIRRNVTANSQAVDVEVVHGAVHYAGDSAFADFGPGHDNTASRVAAAQTSVTIKVPALTLRDVLTRHGIGDYALVCDIEGAEVGLIEQDAAALARCRQIIIELHDTEWKGRSVTITELRDALKRLGFRVQAQHGPACVFEKETA